MSSSEVIALAERLVAGMRGQSDETDDQLQAAWETLADLCENGDPALCTDALAALAPGLDDIEPYLVGRLAICCGAVMEFGASPDPAIEPFLARLPRQLELAATFVDRLREHAIDEEEEDDHDEEELEWFGFGSVPKSAITSLSAVHGDEAGAFESIEPFGLGCIALLSRSPAARARAREHPGWVELAYRCDHDFLARILQVLDDEPLLVLHPESECGWRFTIGGISENFQLNGLLMGALVGSGSLLEHDGDRPSDEALATLRGTGPQTNSETLGTPWDLYNWAALQPDGSWQDEYEPGLSDRLWIWNEGVPADIDYFEGTRTVLIAPPTVQRFFGAQRTFDGLAARLDHEETLSPDEVRTILQRIRETPRDLD